ncbi:hypothetical protein ACQP25_29775 [Microtetraspora malaysiensis]|uniref:hypothetical protein n=1 Tax=Microtetraspora malaysiensis TaxID=161358 RepID=UPI003D94C4EC
MSRIPLREALRRLHDERLVILVPRQGALVTGDHPGHLGCRPVTTDHSSAHRSPDPPASPRRGSQRPPLKIDHVRKTGLARSS